ncbi:MAG: family 10 glycosylhydrolase [Leptolyngbyaceae cyanobacterium CSU_1_3]|nr:family 10 glycosylhydrolase [Leptolyngbyaceae cyanobacterium CSU_1_3]
MTETVDRGTGSPDQKARSGFFRSLFSHWGRRSILAVCSFWVVVALWQAPIVPVTKTSEIRGVWMTNRSASLMHYTTRLDETMANLARHRLNTLYPCVWNRGQTLHPSGVFQRASRTGRSLLAQLPGYDVLSGLVQQGHRQHLRVIPWFEYGLMIPIRSPIAQRHPDWLTTTQSGAITLDSDGQPKKLPKPIADLKETFFGIDQGWLNPVHPQVQQFLTDLIVDVVKRYSVDGIQLDDHFALPIEFGYDRYTIERYQADHRGNLPSTNPSDPEWMAWRAKQLTQLMGKISKAVRAAKPNMLISLSPNTPDYAYRKSLQDWRRWVKLGLVDEVVVQIYRSDVGDFKAGLETGGFADLKGQVPIAVGLYAGRFLSAKPIRQLQQEVEAVRSSDYAGVSFFCWETTLWLFKRSSESQVQQAFARFFQ